MALAIVEKGTRDRDGSILPDVNPHHWRCDGNGRVWAGDPHDPGGILACPACRPHLAVRPQPVGRPSVTLADA